MTVNLRAIEPEDLDLLYRIENDVRLWNVGTSNVPYSRYVLHDYVAHVTNDIYTDRQVRMMIENEEGKTVGIVDLVNFDPANRRAELGLIILNDFRRQGYAMATLEQIHDYARRILHLHQIYGFLTENNITMPCCFSMYYESFFGLQVKKIRKCLHSSEFITTFAPA